MGQRSFLLKSEAEDILKMCGKTYIHVIIYRYIQLDKERYDNWKVLESYMEETEENRQGRIKEEKVKDIW